MTQIKSIAIALKILVASNTFSVGGVLLNFQNSVTLMKNEGVTIPKAKTAVMNTFPNISASSIFVQSIIQQSSFSLKHPMKLNKKTFVWSQKSKQRFTITLQ